jgi:transposase
MANRPNNNKPVEDYILEEIAPLRAKGLSFRAIAEKLGIGESTVRKHQNYKGTTTSPEYTFTKRQLEIAIAAHIARERKK